MVGYNMNKEKSSSSLSFTKFVKEAVKKVDETRFCMLCECRENDPLCRDITFIKQCPQCDYWYCSNCWERQVKQEYTKCINCQKELQPEMVEFSPKKPPMVATLPNIGFAIEESFDSVESSVHWGPDGSRVVEEITNRDFDARPPDWSRGPPHQADIVMALDAAVGVAPPDDYVQQVTNTTRILESKGVSDPQDRAEELEETLDDTYWRLKSGDVNLSRAAIFGKIRQLRSRGIADLIRNYETRRAAVEVRTLPHDETRRSSIIPITIDASMNWDEMEDYPPSKTSRGIQKKSDVAPIIEQYCLTTPSSMHGVQDMLKEKKITMNLGTMWSIMQKLVAVGKLRKAFTHKGKIYYGPPKAKT